MSRCVDHSRIRCAVAIVLVYVLVYVIAATSSQTFAAVIGGSIVTGAGASSTQVNRFDAATLNTTASFFAYPSFTGGVHVAAGDFNADGVPDMITAPEAGAGPNVTVFNGANTAATLNSFFAYSPSLTGGVYLAAADFNHDGKADIVTAPGPDPASSPNVKVFNANGLGTLLNFFAYTPSFTGGVTVAAGDVNHDGTPDIITAPASGGGPNVNLFDGTNGTLLNSFFAYSPSFTGGVFVAAGDVNGDGYADIITGEGATGSPIVNVFSGKDLSTLASFFAYSAAFTGGVRVAAADLTGDGLAEIITAPGPGAGPEVRAFDLSGGNVTQVRDFNAYAANFPGGVFVAASDVPEPSFFAATLLMAAPVIIPRRRGTPL